MDINFYSSLRKIIGAKTFDLPLPAGTTVREMVEAIVAYHPDIQERLLDEMGELDRHAHIFVNGRDVPHLVEGFETMLSADDTVDVFPIGHF
jgi:MoaD family protein